MLEGLEVVVKGSGGGTRAGVLLAGRACQAPEVLSRAEADSAEGVHSAEGGDEFRQLRCGIWHNQTDTAQP